MSSHGNTYPCPWCEADRPRTKEPCPQCGHVDKKSILPHHVHGMPGGDAIADTPLVLKVFLAMLVMWLILTLAFILKYG